MVDEPQDGSDPTEPDGADLPDTSGPSVAGLVVVGALVLFGLVLFLANFTGQVADPGNGKRSDQLFKDNGGAKQGKRKPRRPKARPEEELWHLTAIEGQPAPPADAPNLVVVTVAALRRDALGPYGGPAELTPNLTRLAGRGARFVDVISASPFSRTAAIAMFTGQHAASLDLVEPRSKPNDRVVPPDVTLLSERLSAAGWQTLGVTANFNFNVEAGLAQGFHHYRESQPMGFSLTQRLDGPDAVGHALSMLDARSDEDRERPFYLQLALVDPHVPLRTYDEEMSKHAEADNPAYTAAVERVDKSVGALLEGLGTMGHADDTIVVFVASHGEGLNNPEHHGKMHGRLLFDTSVVVPWIVAGPGVKPGHLVGGLASHLDMSPTLLDLLGLPVPDGSEGSSWAAQIRGEQARTTRQSAISDTWYFQANRASIWTEARQCQKDFGSGAMQDSFVDGCYDRRTDPHFTNLIEDAALMADLEAWRVSLEGLVTTEGPLASTPEGGAPEGG